MKPDDQLWAAMLEIGEAEPLPEQFSGNLFIDLYDHVLLPAAWGYTYACCWIGWIWW